MVQWAKENKVTHLLKDVDRIKREQLVSRILAHYNCPKTQNSEEAEVTVMQILMGVMPHKNKGVQEDMHSRVVGECGAYSIERLKKETENGASGSNGNQGMKRPDHYSDDLDTKRLRPNPFEMIDILDRSDAPSVEFLPHMPSNSRTRSPSPRSASRSMDSSRISKVMNDAQFASFLPKLISQQLPSFGADSSQMIANLVRLPPDRLLAAPKTPSLPHSSGGGKKTLCYFPPSSPG